MGLSACSQPWLLRLRPMLTLMPSMATTAMAIILAMPTMDTTAIPMPTMDTTMARGPLMPRLPPVLRPSPRLRLMPMLTIMHTDMAFPMPDMDTVLPTTDTAMPTTDTTDTPVLMPTDTTDMPTVDTTATPTDTAMD